MKATRNQNKRSGFTLIEMVGVLAVIAILAALLVPKIFAAINESRLNNAVGSINACKTATMNYFAKEGRFTAGADFDAALLTAGYLEKPFDSKVTSAGNADCEVVACTNGAANTGTGDFDLDGNGTADEVPVGSNVVQIKLVDVAADDAWELSQRIDGDSGGGLTEADATTADAKGRVVYAAAGADGVTDVYIYIAHK